MNVKRSKGFWVVSLQTFDNQENTTPIHVSEPETSQVEEENDFVIWRWHHGSETLHGEEYVFGH